MYGATGIVLVLYVAIALAIAVWVVYASRTSPHSFSIFLSFLVIAFAAEGLLQRYHSYRILAKTQERAL